MNLFPKYPKAHINRVSPHDKSVVEPRRAFLRSAGLNFLYLQILFLGLFAYIYGSLYQQNTHVHNLDVLFVDYDGGVIGTSVRNAYQSLRGDGFFTLTEHTASEYESPVDMREAVCKTRYWAALYTSPGATSRLEDALSGGSVAETYNRSDVLTFIWNEALYSTVVDSSIANNMRTLSDVARTAYTSNATVAFGILTSNFTLDSPSSAAALSVFATPWQITDVNIKVTTQGSRLIYNTIVIILILIQEFFYLGTINGLYVQFKIYARLHPCRIIAFRNAISLAYTFVGSLCTTGAIWAFRSSWNVNGNQFVLTWMALWLFAHVNFLTLDVFTIWLPPPFVPMALISWVVLNVASILLPFELSPAFYRWAYAVPAHEVYQVLADIWSGGCVPHLDYALPILFSLEISGLLLGALGVYRRCHYAVVTEEVQERQFRERLEAAMAFERKRDKERRSSREGEGEKEQTLRKTKSQDAEGAVEEAEAEEIEEEEEERELEEVIRREDNELRRESTRAENVNFGPSFGLAFRSRTRDE